MILYPKPSPEGLARLQEFYRSECGMEISNEQAYEILSGVMRFLYLTEIKPSEIKPLETEANETTATRPPS